MALSAPNLAIAPFGNHNLYDYAPRLFGKHCHLGGSGALTVQFHPFRQPHRLFIADIGPHRYPVAFGNVIAGVHDLVGKIPVVGQQQKAF